MTTKKLNQIIHARTHKIFKLWSEGKITLQENMEMYIKMIEGYKRKYPIQMGNIFAARASPDSGEQGLGDPVRLKLEAMFYNTLAVIRRQ